MSVPDPAANPHQPFCLLTFSALQHKREDRLKLYTLPKMQQSAWPKSLAAPQDSGANSMNINTDGLDAGETLRATGRPFNSSVGLEGSSGYYSAELRGELDVHTEVTECRSTLARNRQSWREGVDQADVVINQMSLQRCHHWTHPQCGCQNYVLRGGELCAEKCQGNKCGFH